MKKVQMEKAKCLKKEDMNLSSGELALSESPYATGATQTMDWEGQGCVWFQQWKFLFGFICNNSCHPFYNWIQNSFLLEKRDQTIFPVGWRGSHEDYYMHSSEAVGSTSDVIVIEK